jgi:uncharacterized protein YdhG (YjbR/CyaY superfamily)
MSVIDDYLARYEGSVRNELERIRSIAHRLLPEYEEAITYSMPTIQYKGKSIIGFNVYKNHVGIYPFSGQAIPQIEELKNYETSKGAIQERFDNLLPDSLIEKIIQERLKQAGV